MSTSCPCGTTCASATRSRVRSGCSPRKELRARYDVFLGEEDFLNLLPGPDLTAGVHEVGPFLLQAHPVTHAERSHAFRVTLAAEPDAPGLVYSGDCGVADDLVPLVRPGDTLLCEAFWSTLEPIPAAMHLTAAQAAGVAASGRRRRARSSPTSSMPTTRLRRPSLPERSSRARSGSPRSGSSSTSAAPGHESVLMSDRAAVDDPSAIEASGVVRSIRSRTPRARGCGVGERRAGRLVARCRPGCPTADRGRASGRSGARRHREQPRAQARAADAPAADARSPRRWRPS